MRLLPFLLLMSWAAGAQTDKNVMVPVRLLFEGMKLGDSAMIHRAFHTTQTLSTVLIDSKSNKPILKVEPLSDFLKAVGSPHKDVYNELIWAPKIEIDGNFAQVWVNYAFYAGKTFSHCGVDAFHLIKDDTGQWKIFALVDTRQKAGCEVPKEVSESLK